GRRSGGGRPRRRQRIARRAGGHGRAFGGGATLLPGGRAAPAASHGGRRFGRGVRAGPCLRRARSHARAGGSLVKPRVLSVSRRVDTPLSPSLERKWSAVGDKLDFRVLAGGAGGNGAFHLVGRLPALDGAAFFAALPARIARQLRDFRPHAVLAQGAHEAAAALTARKLANVETAVIVDIHGDWRAPTRLYGSRFRALLNPLADRAALTALRNADGIRTVTAYTTDLVRDLGLEPTDEFPAYMDFDSFLREPPRPLPGRRYRRSRPGREERAPRRGGESRCARRRARPHPDRPRAGRAARCGSRRECRDVDDLARGVRVPSPRPRRAGGRLGCRLS